MKHLKRTLLHAVLCSCWEAPNHALLHAYAHLHGCCTNLPCCLVCTLPPHCLNLSDLPPISTWASPHATAPRVRNLSCSPAALGRPLGKPCFSKKTAFGRLDSDVMIGLSFILAEPGQTSAKLCHNWDFPCWAAWPQPATSFHRREFRPYGGPAMPGQHTDMYPWREANVWGQPKKICL